MVNTGMALELARDGQETVETSERCQPAVVLMDITTT